MWETNKQTTKAKKSLLGFLRNGHRAMTLGLVLGLASSVAAEPTKHTAHSRQGSWHSPGGDSRGPSLWQPKTPKSSFCLRVNRFLPLLPVERTPLTGREGHRRSDSTGSMLLSESRESVLPARSTDIIAACTIVPLREETGDRAGSAGRAFLTPTGKGHQFLWVTSLVVPESHFLRRAQNKRAR